MRVLNAVGTLVRYAKAGDDEKLVSKIKEVSKV